MGLANPRVCKLQNSSNPMFDANPDFILTSNTVLESLHTSLPVEQQSRDKRRY